MKRLNFLITEDNLAKLDALVTDLGFRTRTDLLHSAIALFEWVAKERRAGNLVISIDAKNDIQKEPVMPGLPAVAEKPDTLASSALPHVGKVASFEV